MKTIQEDISTFRMGRKELKPRMESIPVRLAPTKVCKGAPHPSFAHSRAPVQQEEGDGGSECVGRGQNVDDASGWREVVRSPHCQTCIRRRRGKTEDAMKTGEKQQMTKPIFTG